MAETQEATLGYGGEFWLYKDSALYELKEVKEFDVPSSGAREQVETTHLKSPDWRREYTSGFYEDSDFDVVLNGRAGSDTDKLLEDALAVGDVRAFKAVLPEDGEPATQVEGTARCTGYTRGRVAASDPMESTATFRIVTIEAIADYVAP